jgi:kynurenine formamidase
MDPPAHLFAGRTTLDQFPASQFIGKALVIDCRSLNEGEKITMDQIHKYGKTADEVDFLLFNLNWDKR